MGPITLPDPSNIVLDNINILIVENLPIEGLDSPTICFLLSSSRDADKDMPEHMMSALMLVEK